MDSCLHVFRDGCFNSFVRGIEAQTVGHVFGSVETWIAQGAGAALCVQGFQKEGQVAQLAVGLCSIRTGNGGFELLIFCVADQTFQYVANAYLQDNVHTTAQIEAQVHFLGLDLLVRVGRESQVIHDLIGHRIQRVLDFGRIVGVLGFDIRFYLARYIAERKFKQGCQGENDGKQTDNSFILHGSSFWK